MCDCFHLAFPNWHAASSGTGAGRRLRGPEPGTEDDSICDEPSQLAEGERPRPQGSSPVEEFPESEKYTDSDKECEAEHDPHHKSGSGKKTKKSGLGSMFEKRSTPKMSKLKEVHSPESGVIVKTAKDGCAEGLIYGGGGKEGIFIKQVVPESPASKSLKLKEGDQVLSATVYFDNVSYEDAVQILEHAQAYKVKLCLKRKPDITETEPTIESDVIPEEDLYAPEMREQGKTKRRGDARISWPKFPSFGKGRKSRFTRSHSSSEADEQRKLELSPTTSDTESPIKSQDALKGKKKHKIKLSVLTKRGRVSSSEDQDTDTPTPGQISGKILETHESDMLSPECLESPPGETPEVYVTGDLKGVEALRLEQRDQKMTEPQTVQHKAELISIDSTLKTADLTVALADKEGSSDIKSPDGKKKKKERSELKMKILGKDKSHKKDAKAKSPKRLKTLGASIEIPDQPENEKSDVIPSFASHTKLQGDQTLDTNTQIISSESSRVIPPKSVTTHMEMSIPKVELDISDVAFIRKSPQKSEEKMKGKDIKQKQEKKTGPTFKLPKIGLGDIGSEETIQKMNVKVEERTIKIEQLTTEGTEMKVDPYEQLSKSSLSRTLPKREEIEIPGMEDMSMRTTAKGIKEPKAGFMGHHEEIQAETVQMSIDVDSVKEAVSKLPGFKLPKVDPSGVPIPEEIIVIDANAQRISVKTPTKVVDTKTKHEAHFTEFDITASPEISKTTVKLPKMTPADLTSEELVMETKLDFKKYKTKAKQSDKEIKTEVYKREDIIIPGKESAQEETIVQTKITDKIHTKKAKMTTPGFGVSKPDIKIPNIGIDFPKQNISKQKCETAEGDRTIFTQEVNISKTESRKGKGQIGGVTSDVKIPGIDGIEYIDSVDGSPSKKDGGICLPGFGVNLDAVKPNVDISFSEIKGEEHTIKLPKFGTTDISVNLSDADKDVTIDETEIKTFERQGKGSKFKMPNVGISMPKVKGPKIDLSASKKDVDVTLPEAKVDVKLPEAPDADVALGNIDVSIPEQKMEVEKHEFEIKPLTIEGEVDGQGSKFKMPKFGIKMPKIKGAEYDFSLSKKDADVTLLDVKAEGKLPEVPETDITLGRIDVSIPQQKMTVTKPELEIKPLQTDGELDGQGSRFKMPKLGIAMPKVKGPEIDLSLSKKDVDVTLPEAEAEAKLPDVEHMQPGMKAEVKAPEIAVYQQDVEGTPSKFKMPTFKLPKFGAGTPHASVKVPDMDKDVKFDGADINVPEEGPAVNIEAPSVDFEGPSIDMKTTGTEQDGKGGKFKMPHLGFSMPKVKGPKIDLSLSRKDADVTLPEAKADITLPDVNLGKVEAKMEVPEAKLPEAPTMEMKPVECETEIDGHGGKFKMPKFGIKIPKVKGPEFDLSSSKKDIDVKLPEAKADVRLPEVDLGKVDVSVPEAKMEIEKPELEMQSLQIEGELDGQGERFTMPKFGVKMPKIKGPEFDLSLSKKDVDMTLPQKKAEVKLPDAPKMDVSLGKAEVLIPEAKAKIEKPELGIKPLKTEVEGQGSRFKMPKFGKVKGPEFHLGFSKKDVDVTLPEAKTDVTLPDVELKEPSAEVEIKAPEIKVAAKDKKGSPAKFEMPDYSLSMPKVKVPDIHLSLSKKDTDITLPGAKADVKLPGAPKIDASLGKAEVSIPEAKVEVKKPEVEIKPLQTDVELQGQEGKFKMPKFGITMPKVKGPDIDLSFSKKDVNVTLPDAKAEVELPEAPEIDVNFEKVDVSIPEAKIEVKKPGLDIKPLQPEGELEGHGGKFKMPKFGMSMPKVKGPEIDFSLSKKDVEITLPEAKADVNLPDVELKEPSGKVEMKSPETEYQLRSVKESPSKFKMPTFKFPKFGVATPNVSAEIPDMDKEIKIDGADMHISVPQTDIDVPEVKAEVCLPEVEVKELSGGVVIDQQPSVEVDAKMKKPRFSLPRFSFSKASVKAPEVDVSLPDVNVAIPEGKVEVKGGEVDIKPPECEAEVDGQGGKFKMPKFGITMPKVTGPEIDLSLSKKDANVTLPEARAEVKLPDYELKGPSAEVEIKSPEIKVVKKDTDESPSKFKMPSFKLPKLGVGMPSATVEVPDTHKDIKIDDADIKIPEEVLTVDVAAPSIDTEGLSIHVKTTGTEHEGKGGTFKMPKFGITMPKVTGPEIDISSSKKDVDVTLPEAKAEVKLPELKEPSAEVEIKSPEIKVGTKTKEGSPSKFKMPSFKLPKFGVGMPSATIEVPDTHKDIKIDDADIKIPEEVLTVDIAAPSIDTEVPAIDMKTAGAEHEGKGGKFKMPKFGITMPKVTGPEIDLSLSKKDVDVTLPEAKAEVKLPDYELKRPSAEVEIKAPEIKVVTKDKEASPSKFKMPSFKLPKFGVGMPSATVEVPDADKDVKIDGADIKIPEEVLTVAIAAPSIDTDIPAIDMKTAGAEHEGKGGKFKMPKFGITMPKVTGPEIDLSLSKKDVDVTLPEAKAEVKLPDYELKGPSAEVEIKAPEIKVVTKDKEASPSKFKMPSFKLPKFGVGMPSATVEVPDTHKDIKIDEADIKIPEEVLTVDIAAPSIDTDIPAIDMKTAGAEHEGKGGKFKMPKFGITMPKVTGPEIDLSLSKKDIDVTLPEAKAEVKLPDYELKGPSAEVEIKSPEIKVGTKDKEVSPSKFKMPSFKLPKFGVSMPSATAEVPDTHKDIKIDGVDVTIPEEVLTVDIRAPSIDTEGPSIHMKTTEAEREGKESKFKMPKFGITMPKVTGPEIDLSLSKKDVDVTLPEAKAEVKLPDVELKEPSAEVEIKSPDIKVGTKTKEGSPSKFKMPTFKLPKFGVGMPSATVEVPDADKDVKIDGADIKIPEEVLTVAIAAPSIDTDVPAIDMKTAGAEHEGKGGKFKMPKFGITMPKVTGPEIDLSLSKKDVDVTLPEAKAEVKLPDYELKESSAKVEIKAPGIDVQTSNVEGSPSKFKMPTFKFPKFGTATPQVSVEVPDVDKDIKVDGAELKLPQTEAEVKLPDVEIKEPVGSISVSQTPMAEGDVKLKKRFSLPKFSFSKQTSKDLGVDVSLPEGNVEVKQPEVELQSPEVDAELDGQGSKFKMPKFGISMPKVKGPEIDLSLSKKDVDVTLPEAKAEVHLPDVKIKQPSAKVEIKAPEIGAQAGDVEGSPSKLKMPTFTLPKFGAPKVSVEVPDVDKDIKVDGAKLEKPKMGAEVDVKAPSIETEGLSVDVKAKGTELQGSGSKFKMPKFGISMPKVKGPEIDLSLSKKDVDVTLPEAKVEVQLPDAKIKQPSAKMEIKAPEIETQAVNVEGSPSKFKMPTFTLPKFGAATPQVSVDVPDVDKNITIEGAKLEIPREGAKLDVTVPSVDTEGLSVDMKAKGTEIEGSGGKFKMPKFGISMPKVKGPEIDLNLSKKDKDVTIPEAKAEINLPNVEVKEPEGAISVPDAPTIDAEAKLKRPNWTFPKFSFSRTSGKAPDVDVNLETPKVDVTSPEVKAEVSLPDVEVQGPSGAISMGEPTAAELDTNLKKTKFSLPRFSFSKSSIKEPEVTTELPHVDVSLPEVNVEVKQSDVKSPEGDVELDVQGSKFKMPKFGISMPKVKGPEIDVSLSKKDVDITLPEAKAEVKLPDVEIKQPSAKVEIKAPEIEAQSGNVEGSGSKFKMPKFGISMPKVKGPEIDLSLSKKDVDVTLPEAKVEVQLPDAKIKQPSAKMEIKAPEIEAQAVNVEGSPSKFKMPTFTLPKFGAATPQVSVEVPDVDKDIKVDGAKLEIPKMEAKVDVTAPSIETEGLSVDVKAQGTELEGAGSKFKMPKFGISMPKVKGPEIDLSLSKKDVGVTLPDVKAEVQLPDVKVKQPSAKVDIKAPEIEAQKGNVEGSPSKLKMPTFTLPKFGAATPKVSVEVPDVDKDIKINAGKLEIPKEGAKVNVTAPSVDTEGLSVDVKAKGTEIEGSGSKFKMPKFGISMPKVKGPEIDLSLSKKDVDITLPEAKAEVKLPHVEIKQPSAKVEIKAPEIEAQAVNVEGSPSKLKMPTFTLPKFGGAAPKVSVEVPDVDKDIKIDGKLELPKEGAEVDLTAPSIDTEGLSVDVKAKGTISVPDAPAVDAEAKSKRPNWTFPKFSFSRTSGKAPEVSAELPHVDISLPEGEVKVRQPEMEIKPPELETEHDGQGSKFKLPKFGIALPKVKGPEEDLKASQKDVDITLPEIKAEVKLPEIEVKSSANVEMKASETEVKSKDVGGSPLKFKMPTVKMPKFGSAAYDVTAEVPDAEKVAETDGVKLKEDVSVNIKGPSVDIKPDISKETITDTETPKTETESVGLGSPSKFKLPSFKMPKLSFSRSKTEDENSPVETERKEDQPEMDAEVKGETKSPKMSLTSFGEILKNFDVEFDVPKTDKEEENTETSKEVHEADVPSGKQLDTKEKEMKQETPKSPERTGWFKFPKFGLSSPSEPAKIPEKDKHKEEQSPVGDEEISPTCSVQSSDAFADISSAMTSEHLGLSLSSPTKVTVKYSDPDTVTGLGEMHSNIITSTTRTELISVEPNLPEKITILSSGVSSSSEDTLRLESGKIHVITSNIQATPESQHAKLLTSVQVQSAGGLPLKSEGNESASWTVEGSQSGKRTIFERHSVRETSSERSESKETIVITKQITHRFDSSEPITGETASSIQRLRDSVHSEKMKFFDGAEK